MPAATPLFTILAIDTARGPGSVAVLRAGKIAAFLSEPVPGRMAARLLVMIEEALGAAGITYADLDKIAVTTGPGSFTGIRIGVATARAIGLAADKPVHGYGTLELIAWAAHEESRRQGLPMLVLMDAHRQQAYLQRFTAQGMRDGAAGIVSYDAIAAELRSPVLLVTDLHALVTPHATRAQLLPAFPVTDAGMLAALAMADPRETDSAEVEHYLRPADAKPQKPLC